MPEIEEMTEIEIEYEALLTQLRENDIDGFREDFLDLHTYEQSEFYSDLEEADRALLYEVLSPEEVSMFFDSLEIDDDEAFDELFETMDARYAAEMIGRMQYDNSVDILNKLPKSKVTTFLALMDRADAAEIRSLLNYEEDTAGGIMTTEFVSLSSLMTVREAMRHLKDVAQDSETIYYVFIVDEKRKLVGIMSLRELIVADDDEYIGDIMNERVVSVFVSDDQEEVAQIMRDYDFLALPVLDYQEHLVGIITADDIMDVIDEEASEDYSRLAGMSETERTSDTSWETAKKRLPWLVGLTFMGMITAGMLSFFEDTLAQVVLLGAFIPLIAGMAGNTGTQSLAVVVRGISTGEVDASSKVKLVWREVGSGLITGLSCGLLIYLIILVMYQEPILGMIVAFSLFVAMTVATFIGTVIPMFMNRIGIDPAVASGPFITTGNDIVSLMIYFSLANIFMAALL